MFGLSVSISRNPASIHFSPGYENYAGGGGYPIQPPKAAGITKKNNSNVDNRGLFISTERNFEWNDRNPGEEGS